MRRDLKVVFKSDIDRIKKLRGSDKREALKVFNEKLDVYMTAKDFSEYYPNVYTPEMLGKIVNARNGIEASNIMTTLRRTIPC